MNTRERGQLAITVASTPSAVSYASPFLAIGEKNGSITLYDTRDTSIRPTRIPTDSTSQVLALGLGLRPLSSGGVIVAFAVERLGSYDIKIALNGRLRKTIRSPHRTPPISLAFSPQQPDEGGFSVLASLSTSEIVLLDPSSGTCTWSLRGPSPVPALSLQGLNRILWCPAPRSTNLEMIGLWSDGTICLWSLDATREAAPAVLQWRAGPKDRRSSDRHAVCDISEDGTFFISTAPLDEAGVTSIMVWDVEDRRLLQQHSVSLPSDIFSLQVYECTPMNCKLFVSTASDVFFLDLGDQPITAQKLLIPELTNRGLNSLPFRHWDSTSGGATAAFSVGNEVFLCDMRAFMDTEALKHEVPSVASRSAPTEASRKASPQAADFAAAPPTPTATAFNPAWVSEDLEDRTALRAYLECARSFPPAHRVKIYSILLNCPSSPRFFALLSTPEDESLLEHFRSEWELEDWLVQGRMESMIHLLHAHGFNRALLLDRIPPLMHGFVSVFPDDVCTLQELFEVTLTVLLLWGRVWWDESVLPDRLALFALVEGCLSGQGVLGILKRNGVSFNECIEKVGFGLLNGFLSTKQWIKCMDHLIARERGYFVPLLAAIFLECEEDLAVFNSTDAVRAYFRQPHHLSLERVLSSADSFEKRIRGTELGRHLPTFGVSSSRLDGMYVLV